MSSAFGEGDKVIGGDCLRQGGCWPRTVAVVVLRGIGNAARLKVQFGAARRHHEQLWEGECKGN
jgi:hypothetical protein